MEEQSKLERNYGIDLLRILSMFMVVVLHVLGHGGILEQTSKFSLNYYVAWLLETFAFCAVDVFAMISGYVMVNRKFNPLKIIPLWILVWFYSALITVLFIIVPQLRALNMLTFQRIVANFCFPVISVRYWYFSEYFCMYFFIPFFNMIISSMDKKDYHRFFLTVTILFCGFTIIRDAFVLNNGYSFVWLSCLYFVGAYFKIYPVKITKRKALCLYIFSAFFAWLSKFLSGILIRAIFHKEIDITRLIMYTSPFIVLSAVGLLLLFSNLQINSKKIQKLIIFVSSLSFSVYIIHDNKFIRNSFILGKFSFIAEKSAFGLLFYVLLCALGIFVFCILVDLIRYALFKILRIEKIPKLLEEKTHFEKK